jgi:integrase
MKATLLATPENVIPLTVKPKAARPPPKRQRFKIQPFENKRTESQSWRVTGTKRDGSRVRENFADQVSAECRQNELEIEWLARQTETGIRATRLTEVQVRLAESVFMRLDADEEILSAVDHWLKHGKQLSIAESPRLDEAVEQYLKWVQSSTLRDATKRHYQVRMNVFRNSVSNNRIADITPEAIEAFLETLKVSAGGKQAYKLVVSRFFSWCMERPRRWSAINPCSQVRVAMQEKAPPSVLTVDECKELLKAAETFKEGRLAPYVAVCLFGGLRPTEAQRLTWDGVNLTDGEIRLHGTQTKTGRPRVVAICPTLAAWLKAYKGKPFYPSSSSWRELIALKATVGFGTKTDNQPDLKRWTPDIMRHTAISHYFRKTGSYGQTAEQFGNSEAIIKQHYQGRVSSDDMKKFYAIKPRKKRQRA